MKLLRESSRVWLHHCSELTHHLRVAQLVERLSLEQVVEGPSPSSQAPVLGSLRDRDPNRIVLWVAVSEDEIGLPSYDRILAGFAV